MSQPQGLQSSGRGGAGNIVDKRDAPRTSPEDLVTPTLKTPVVTTGRGGTGNMAANRDPAETRMMQDVEPVERQPSRGATHVGRGGTGNVTSEPDLAGAMSAVDSVEGSERDSRKSTGWLDMAKRFLLGKKR